MEENTLLRVHITVKGDGSNYKYRWSDINGSFNLDFDESELEFVFQKESFIEFGVEEGFVPELIPFLKSLDSKQLYEFGVKAIITNYRAPKSEIRDCTFYSEDGESEVFYWLEDFAPQIFTTHRSQEKYPVLNMEWDITVTLREGI